ncbi:YidC/Oxa1 family membrane protein insertase [Dethiothermospora halolimnae]|uniref:YidC/Oxa1 family membrane protein insertase n=1 Tax=Dethiothermospora halolimnae TaxID=3114390 RepID=UPI003CCC067F
MDMLQALFNNVNNITNDYGLTIILITILFNLILLPMRIKQKKSMELMQDLSIKTNKIKDKYKNDENRMNQELQKLYKDNPKSMMGCFMIILQMPMFMVMYKLFKNNITDVSTVIFPWLTSLSLPDPYFILPIIYVVIQLMPGILSSLNIIKSSGVPKLTKQTIIIPVVMSILLVAKTPAALGIYFLTSSLIQSTQQILS